MKPDPNKKTLRSFQCRDYLWDVFEKMSVELECSVDYLINESMRQYARQRQTGALPGATVPENRDFSPATTGAVPRHQPSIAPLSPFGAPTPSFATPSVMPPAAASARLTAPPPLPPAAYTGSMGAYTHAPPVVTEPRSLQNSSPFALPTLYVIIDGQKVRVTKPEFVLGRSSKTADLAIPDGNVSRRHAVIVYQNGVFYFRDLGSTNGIEFQGHRIESKAIEEGDTFSICDHQIKFTFR